MAIVGNEVPALSHDAQSWSAAARPEIDFMNGYVVTRGAELGVNTPLNAALTTMVNEIAQGARRIDPQNLAGPLPRHRA